MGDVLRSAELALLVTPPFTQSIGNVRGIKQFQETKNNPGGAYPLTDSECTLPGSGTFHNLGVRHVDWFWNAHHQHIKQRIDAADVVLLEGTGNEISGAGPDPFFAPLYQYAKEQGKKRVVIDHQVPAHYPKYYFGTLSASFLGGMLLLLGSPRTDDKSQNVPGQRTVNSTEQDAAAASAQAEHMTRRSSILSMLGRAIGWPALLAAPHSLLNRPAQALEIYPTWALSYEDDGRTVLMLDRIMRAAKEHPDSRVLAITGNVHARGYSKYLENQTLFNAKLRLYNLAYVPLLESPSPQSP